MKDKNMIDINYLMHKLPIREMKNILEQRIDYNSAVT